jgi:hypothetical protein
MAVRIACNRADRKRTEMKFLRRVVTPCEMRLAIIVFKMSSEDSVQERKKQTVKGIGMSTFHK